MSDGGNRPDEVRQPVKHGAKSYKPKGLEDEVFRRLFLLYEEAFVILRMWRC